MVRSVLRSSVARKACVYPFCVWFVWFGGLSHQCAATILHRPPKRFRRPRLLGVHFDDRAIDVSGAFPFFQHMNEIYTLRVIVLNDNFGSFGRVGKGFGCGSDCLVLFVIHGFSVWFVLFGGLSHQCAATILHRPPERFRLVAQCTPTVFVGMFPIKHGLIYIDIKATSQSLFSHIDESYCIDLILNVLRYDA